MKNTNMAAKDTSIRDRYGKELGQLPHVEPGPFRATDMAALSDSVRRLQRTIGRLSSAFILLTIVLVAIGIADHWTAIQAALVHLDQWRQQWMH